MYNSNRYVAWSKQFSRGKEGKLSSKMKVSVWKNESYDLINYFTPPVFSPTASSPLKE